VTVLLLLNLFFSFSRSAWIGFAVLCLAAPLVNPRCWRHLVFPIALGAATALLFFRPYFATELAPLITRTSQVSARWDILAKATDMFLAHPVFGAGLGSFLRDYQVQIHNTFFWFLAEMGIVGATVFVGFVVAFFLRGLKAYKLSDPEHRGLVGGLLLAHLSMMGFSLGIEAFYQRHWWVIMAMLSAACAAAGKAGSSGSSPGPVPTLVRRTRSDLPQG
jgi:O-antigen ligase